MTSIIVDRLDGLSSSVAIKGPCRVATTANITLSGTQTIDGVLVAVGDRVLVKNQTTTSENGIYYVDTGAWRRTKDFARSNDIVVGTQIFITSGTLYSQSGWLVSTFTSVGDAAIVFTQNVLVNGAALAALEASAQAASDAAELAQAEAEAAQASAELAASNIIPIGVVFGYSTTTADADPGAGTFRFDNATIASVTAAYIDNVDNAANSVTAWLDTFDDSSNTVKGTLMLRGVTTPTAWAVFDVTGSVVDGTGYRKLTLTHKGSGGVWTNAHTFSMDFCRAGDKGADGAASGDVVGPASAVTGSIASFNGATGKLIADGGVLAADIATLATIQTLTNKTLTQPTLALKQSAAPTPTAEGDIQWDTDDNVLVIGDGAAQKIFVALPASAASGDLLYLSGAKVLSRLAAGGALQTLRQNSGLSAPEWATAREVLTAARTYYVRTDGSDSNTGLADSAGGAFLTLQKAWDVVSSLDLSIYSVTVQVRDGTYTGGVNAITAPVGGGSVTIQGNSGTPSNVVISTTSADAFKFNGIYVNVLVKDLKAQTTTSGYGIQADGPGINVSWQNIDCGACANDHIYLTSGASGVVTGNYSITGAATSHIRLNRGALLASSSRTVTITGTLNFANGFMRADAAAQAAYFSSSFTGGTVTGTRYVLTMLGGVNTFGGGASYFPGNAAGTTATGAQYA